MDEYSELVRRASEEQCAIVNQIIEVVVEAQDHFKGLTLKAQCEIFQDENLKESFEDNPKHTTSQRIGHEKDKEENTPNKFYPEIVVQDTEECILTEVKREEHCDQLLETHLKKEEALAVQPTLQTCFHFENEQMKNL